MTTLVGEATLNVFRGLDPEAYLEKIARTDPKLFHKYVALFVGRENRTDSRNQTIVNVMNAIPRSPLDELPEGFRTK